LTHGAFLAALLQYGILGNLVRDVEAILTLVDLAAALTLLVLVGPMSVSLGHV
jgi:hypothetical protein